MKKIYIIKRIYKIIHIIKRLSISIYLYIYLYAYMLIDTHLDKDISIFPKVLLSRTFKQIYSALFFLFLFFT